MCKKHTFLHFSEVQLNCYCSYKAKSLSQSSPSVLLAPTPIFAQNSGEDPGVGCGLDTTGPILVFPSPSTQAVALEPVVHLLLVCLPVVWESQQGCCVAQSTRTLGGFSPFLNVLTGRVQILCSWVFQTFLETWRSLYGK